MVAGRFNTAWAVHEPKFRHHRVAHPRVQDVSSPRVGRCVRSPRQYVIIDAHRSFLVVALSWRSNSPAPPVFAPRRQAFRQERHPEGYAWPRRYHGRRVLLRRGVCAYAGPIRRKLALAPISTSPYLSACFRFLGCLNTATPPMCGEPNPNLVCPWLDARPAPSHLQNLRVRRLWSARRPFQVWKLRVLGGRGEASKRKTERAD